MKCMKNERFEKHTEAKCKDKAEIQVGKMKRLREKCLGEKRKCFCREKSRKSESDFALDLFKENASRWIEDLSRFCRALVLNR